MAPFSFVKELLFSCGRKGTWPPDLRVGGGREKEEESGQEEEDVREREREEERVKRRQSKRLRQREVVKIVEVKNLRLTI